MLNGVIAAILVDNDGLTISSTDESTELTASLSVLLMENLTKEVGGNVIDKWRWMQCETENSIISIMNAGIGLLVIIMNNEADIEAIRNEATAVKEDIFHTFEEAEDTTYGGIA